MKKLRGFAVVVVLVLSLVLVSTAMASGVGAGPAPQQPTPVPSGLEVISSLLQSVLLAILPVLAAVLINWAMKAAKTEIGKLDQQTLSTLVWLAGIGVKAAEQANLAGYITDKKSYALAFVHGWLKDHGIELDVETLSAAIEAAVMDEFNKPKMIEAAKVELLTDSKAKG